MHVCAFFFILCVCVHVLSACVECMCAGVQVCAFFHFMCVKTCMYVLSMCELKRDLQTDLHNGRAESLRFCLVYIRKLTGMYMM